MDTDSLTAARAFARNLNILLKTARLYGFNHGRTASVFEATWTELRAALKGVGDAGLILGVSGWRVLLDGVPLEATSTDRSFAQLLSSAGLSSIQFSSRLTSEDLACFVQVFATRTPKGESLTERLKSALGEKGEPAIRINEIRFVAQDATLASASLGAEVAARSLGSEARDLQACLRDPQRLLQLIAAAEGAREGPGAPPVEAAKPALEEDAVVQALRFLAQLSGAGDPSSARGQLNMLPKTAQLTLTEALGRLAAASASSKPDAPLLLQLAEHVAIRFALERYERGDVRINSVMELLGRLKREVSALRKVLLGHEERMRRAGLEPESHADVLDRQFWAALPEGTKQKVLLSPEAWAIPPCNIEQFVRELVDRGNAELAKNILSNYAQCIQSPEIEARKKASLGLTDLAGLYGEMEGSVLKGVLACIGERLLAEPDSVLQSLLSASFVRLTQEAIGHRHYEAVRETLDSLEALGKRQPFIAELVRPRIRVDIRLPELLDEALRAPHVPSSLMELLRRVPESTLSQLLSRLDHCTRREEFDRILGLTRQLGERGIARLRQVLVDGPAQEAASTVGLLSQLEPRLIEQRLPGRLGEWEWTYHDQVVRQLASGGATNRGKLLMNLLGRLDPVVLPEALDEIGMSGDQTAAPMLLSAFQRLLHDPQNAFLCIKIIEAMGRLRTLEAGPLLRDLVEAKRLWRWEHPRELRITAAQALEKVDPEWTRNFLAKSGIDRAELMLAPLDPMTGIPWIRQRRYQRVRLQRPMSGVVRVPKGSFRIQIESLSLAGGTCACRQDLRAGTMAGFQVRPGFSAAQANILVRCAQPQRMTFELVNIEPEDRAKIRRVLAAHLGQTSRTGSIQAG